MTNACTTCPRPVPDTAYGCLDCAVALAGTLAQLATVVGELDTTVARLGSRVDDGPQAASAEAPLPYDPHAAEQAAAIHGTLTTWARHVQAETSRALPPGPPAVAACLLLAGAMRQLRYRPEWLQAHRDLAGLLRQTLRVVDLPPDREYVGPCSHVDTDGGQECRADVYARPGAAVTACRSCGTEYDVAACKAWMREQLMDQLARPVEIVGMLMRLGVRLGYSTIAAYAADRRILAHGHDAWGRDLFRIGDVMEVRFPPNG